MKPLLEAAGAPMQWKQPKLSEPLFELVSSGEQVAVLRFKNSFGSLATGISAEGSWTFKRQGFLKSFVSVREAGSETTLAVFHNNTWSEGGTLEFANGRKFQANSNFWNSKFDFRNEAGEIILQFTKIGGFKLHADLKIFPAALLLKETPFLVLLGWYLTVMASREGEMVAALF
jgi:hypothetical protein